MLCGFSEGVRLVFVVCCQGYGDHRDLHVLTHSFPTRRSADLICIRPTGVVAAMTADGCDRPDRFAGTFGRISVCAHSRIPFRRLFSRRSEEHTSELQSLMRFSYAVFCLKHKNTPAI